MGMVTFCKRKNCWVLSILLLVPALSIVAQQTKYNLSNLTEAAKNYLPVLQQKTALLDASKAIVTDVRHSFLPQVKISDQLNIATDNSMAGSYLPLGSTPSVSAGVRADNIYQPATGNIGVVYAEYELVSFGLNKARIKHAEAYTGLAESDLSREQYIIQAQVSNIYFNLLKTQYKLSADKQNVNRYDSIFKIIRALTISGIKAGSDSSLSKAELSKAKIVYNQTLGSLNQLKDQLSYLTGLASDNLDIDSLANGFLIHRPSLISFAADSINNPLLDFYKKKANIFYYNQKLIQKNYSPKIILAAGGWIRGSSIQYNDDYKSLTTGLGYQRFNYAAGVAVTYNLFNGLYKKDRLAINRFQTQASEQELQQQKLLLGLATSQAENALKTNELNLAELPVQLQSATETYNQKVAQYKAGIISLIDLTNASFVLYRSQTDYIETVGDWYIAQLDKAVATGNLLKFIQTIK
jgi:outer membrane protein TolC